MIRNAHRGPLQVQKALYPEDRRTCHVAILHPPGGIAAGDDLRLDTELDEGSRALLTTPGATKWYRSDGAWASQHVACRVGPGAVLEWLPRESIFFDRSHVSMSLDVDLGENAQYFGWDIYCFGRYARGESWNRGRLRLHTSIRKLGRPVWSETANLEAGGGFSRSLAGLSGHTVCGTLVVAGCEIAAAALATCRQVRPPSVASRTGITQVPLVVIARYLGDSSEEAFQWFSSLWTELRPAASGRTACPPRVWAC